jgi:hypothetical protein
MKERGDMDWVARFAFGGRLARAEYFGAVKELA